MLCYIYVIRQLEKVPLQSGTEIQLAKFMVDNNNGLQDISKTRGKYEQIMNTPSSSILSERKVQSLIFSCIAFEQNESVARTGTRSLDPQIKSLMLYRLSYPGCSCLAQSYA